MPNVMSASPTLVLDIPHSVVGLVALVCWAIVRDVVKRARPEDLPSIVTGLGTALSSLGRRLMPGTSAQQTDVQTPPGSPLNGEQNGPAGLEPDATTTDTEEAKPWELGPEAAAEEEGASDAPPRTS